MSQILTNTHSFCIAGESGKGKSASLRNIRNQDKWIYLNAEAGKPLPFKNEFNQYTITDPYQVTQAIDNADDILADNEGIIIDSITMLMDLHESLYIFGSSDSRKGWAEYQQFFKTLIQDSVARYGKPVIFTAHTRTDYHEASMSFKTAIPVKGALKNNGIEAYFTTVVAAKVMAIKDLAPYRDNGLLNITEDEELLGYKHVYQTRLTKETVGERIRGPMGLFTKEQTYIDNDAQLLIDHLHNFYN